MLSINGPSLMTNQIGDQKKSIHNLFYIANMAKLDTLLSPKLLLFPLLLLLAFWNFQSALSLVLFALLAILFLPKLCSIISFCWRCLRTLSRDLNGYWRLRRLQRTMDAKWVQDKPIGWHFRQNVCRWPHKICIVEAENGRSLTFADLNKLANKFGNYFADQLRNGNNDNGASSSAVLGIFLENCVEFVAIWLGLAKLGIPSAWLNTQLRMASLAHSLGATDCCAVVTSEQLLPIILDAISGGLLRSDLKVYCINEAPKYKTAIILDDTKLVDDKEPQIKQLGFQDTLAYLYTSGTTGPPKAVVIRHHRYYFMGAAGPIVYGIRPNDRVYIPLPMYHGMAGIAGISQMVVNGSTVIIRAKFSASHFWHDCFHFDATVALYIGEICRYLLAQPECPEERMHRIRMFCGLGLRDRIWPTFRQRFRVHQIGELYGATEGNACLVNLSYKTGACGFWPIYTKFMRHCSIRLIKVDPLTGDHLRHPNSGLCVLCRPGECGEIVGMIRPGNPIRRFEGYLDQEETEKKIVRDVEEVGDCAFASGDVLHWDLDGFLYFRDRLGDTYRWKGENVSSTEVEGLLQDVPGIEDSAVYGVEVPGEEGRAGMVAIAPKGTAKGSIENVLEMVAARFRSNLPPFAIPVFLRVCGQIERTGTFKLRKTVLRQKGLLLNSEGEKLYIWNRPQGCYNQLGEEDRVRLIAGSQK